MLRAERCRTEGDFDLALRFYNRLLALRPESPVLRLKMATLCDEGLNDPLSALYHYKAFLALAPSSPDAAAVQKYQQMARAKLLRDLGREELPQPPADELEKQRQMVEALKKENVRLVRALRQLSDKCTQLERELRQGNFVKKAALPAPAPAPAAREELYTIRSGDTLSGIAQSYGISLRSLMQANGLNGSSILRAGQVLRIPGQ